jgi:hypothetical protein
MPYGNSASLVATLRLSSFEAGIISSNFVILNMIIKNNVVIFDLRKINIKR